MYNIDVKTNGCVENSKSTKQRYKRVKKDMKTIMDLSNRSIISYEDSDRIIGRQFKQLNMLKQDLDNYKVYKKEMKARAKFEKSQKEK